MADWTFAPSGNGEGLGFHNPGIETFKGDLERHLAREAIQNSLDARLNKKEPVRVTFELLDLDTSDVPGMDILADTLWQCGHYWEATDPKAKRFFERAHGLAMEEQIRCLKISDANTTGVRGTDDDLTQGWNSLVRTSGSSAKLLDEGGSFGLGKHAPFAASRLRTVFYSTKTDTDNVAFQGVARLVTHISNGVRYQPTGFLGGLGGKSLRNKKDIPKAFRRDESGTDVYALGYHADEDWQEQLVHAVLKFFWPAVHNGALMVTVGATTINSKTLPKLLKNYGDSEQFDAHYYHQAYTAPNAIETKKSLPILGAVTVRLLTGDPALPKRVAMVRKTGMVIEYKRFNSRVEYCGVFECRNDVGNHRLRDMEPPP